MKKIILTLALLMGMSVTGVALADTASNGAPAIQAVSFYGNNQMFHQPLPPNVNQNNNMYGKQFPDMRNQNSQNSPRTLRNVSPSGSAQGNRSPYQAGRPITQQSHSFRNHRFGGGLAILFVFVAFITLILVWTALARYIFTSFRKSEKTTIIQN